MLLGIIAGLLSATSQSFSYVCSSGFLMRYRSSLQLVIFSQLAMGLFCLPVAPFLFPRELFSQLPSLLLGLAVWLVVCSIGQFAFFNTLRSIEPSRLSSLLGLKIVVLSFIYVAILRDHLNAWQYLAVLLSALAAVGMNWSGGGGFSLKGVLWLLVTLVAYSLADLTETFLVTLPKNGNMILNACAMSTLCYALLGIVTLPLLLKHRWDPTRFVHSIPFAVTWFLSQLLLFLCFGMLGAVFGNVIISSRGLISILLGVILYRTGHGRLDARLPRKMWIRRVFAALLMAVGIILFSWGKSLN